MYVHGEWWIDSQRESVALLSIGGQLVSILNGIGCSGGGGGCCCCCLAIQITQR